MLAASPWWALGQGWEAYGRLRTSESGGGHVSSRPHPLHVDCRLRGVRSEKSIANNDTWPTTREYWRIAPPTRHAPARYEKIVFLGYAGGGSVYSMYQAQAVTGLDGGDDRQSDRRPVDLNARPCRPDRAHDVVSAPHHGAGKMMQNELDPFPGR